MSTLNSKIETLASTFAQEIIRAIRSASLEEILGQGTSPRASKAKSNGAAPKAPRAKKAGRLGRRTVEQIQAQVGTVVALLKKNPDGLKSEQIKEALKLDRREIPRILSEGLSSKSLKKKGLKRATVYKAAV